MSMSNGTISEITNGVAPVHSFSVFSVHPLQILYWRGHLLAADTSTLSGHLWPPTRRQYHGILILPSLPQSTTLFLPIPQRLVPSLSPTLLPQRVCARVSIVLFVLARDRPRIARLSPLELILCQLRVLEPRI